MKLDSHTPFPRIGIQKSVPEPYVQAFPAYGSPVNLNQEFISFLIRFRNSDKDGPSYKPACTFL